MVAVGALAAAHETSAAVHRVAAELDRTVNARLTNKKEFALIGVLYPRAADRGG